MPTYYPKSAIDAVQELIDAPPAVQPIGVSWHKIMEILQENDVIKTTTKIHCAAILPHPKNRGGLMLNGFNCRANGAKVLKVGANFKSCMGRWPSR